jgi:CheY-like chemotaxis protein
VSDNGVGIAPELLERVFELFTQGQRGLDRAEGGIGIGLNIARGIIELHDGAIEARSAGVGKGSEFVVRLPAAVRAQATDRAAVKAPRDPRRSSAARRVLVVDDNRDAAETMRELLQVYGYATRVAYDGPEALDAAIAFRPDVALVDIGLPAMDGYEVARRIRQLPELRAIRLIAVTGYGQASDRHRTEQAGFDHHLVKPVDVEELKRAIDGCG